VISETVIVMGNLPRGFEENENRGKPAGGFSREVSSSQAAPQKASYQHILKPGIVNILT
jgi:hypothetical protein